jgi:hypothetical protein
VVGGFALAAVTTSATTAGAAAAVPTWAGTTAPVPANADPGFEAAIDAASCPAPGACVAAGSYTAGGKTSLFADTLANGVWSTVQVPNPPNDTYADTIFEAISCPSVGGCVATGQYEVAPSSSLVGFASVLTGGTWSTTALPLPPAFSDPNVTVESHGLSCPAPGWCVQTGSFSDPSDNGQGFIDTLSGGSWTSILAPLPAGAPANPGLDLLSASCGAVGSCVAAGNSSSSNVFDVLANGSWTPVLAPIPLGSFGGEVFSVSCPPNSNQCVGVGDYEAWHFGFLNLAWTVSGTNVTASYVPMPTDVVFDDTQASLNDVSCPVAGWCMAVGQYQSTTFSRETPEAAVLSGGTWSTQQAPGMAAAYSYGALSAVSCSWPGSCAATGVLQDASTTNNLALLDTLTNGVWSGNDAVLPSGGDPTQESFMDRPSCVAGYCLTGGRYNGFGLPFLETHPNLTGYQEVASDGGLFSFNAPFSGSMGGQPLNAPIVGMAVEPDNGAYYEVASDGGIFAFGAPFYGSMGGKSLNKPIMGIAFDTQTGGYYEVASDGGIFAFNAPFYGSMGGKPLNKPIVGIAFDPTTGGYYEIASDGGLFAFNAPFQGSMGGKSLNKPIVGMGVDPVSGGYYEVASDGGLFAFNAPFQGSMGGTPLNQPIVGMDFDYVTGGYYEVASDGGLFAFNAPFQGSMGGKPLNKPVVGVAFG